MGPGTCISCGSLFKRLAKPRAVKKESGQPSPRQKDREREKRRAQTRQTVARLVWPHLRNRDLSADQTWTDLDPRISTEKKDRGEWSVHLPGLQPVPRLHPFCLCAPVPFPPNRICGAAKTAPSGVVKTATSISHPEPLHKPLFGTIFSYFFFVVASTAVFLY